MFIMTPENLLKNLDNALEFVIKFNEKIIIATDDGNALLISNLSYTKILEKLLDV